MSVVKQGAGCALDMGVVMKTAVAGMKSSWCGLLKFYKGFYATCPPKCAPADKFDDVMVAYNIHFCIWLATWLCTLIIYSSIIGGFYGFSIVTLLLGAASGLRAPVNVPSRRVTENPWDMPIDMH